MNKVELLAPVGSLDKLDTALHFGADAVYLAGKEFGLRAYASNLTDEEIKIATDKVHSLGKKIYITLNIFASNRDFDKIHSYIKYLYEIKVDAVIVSDAGIISYIRKNFPNLDIHLSTQANITNKYAVAFWRDIGVKRVVLARELSLTDIKEIYDYVGDSVELEAFVHGAMCISYSGRCLLSNYLANRDSNRGECVQACRWEYRISEVSRDESQALTIEEDKRGTYILNSKDMNTISIIDKIMEAGIVSLKIEGRVKSIYYVGSVVSAYRKAIDSVLEGKTISAKLNEDLNKVAHRKYTLGFYMGKEAEVCLTDSHPDNGWQFVANVLGYDEEKKCIIVQQRNRFFVGDILEVVTNKDIESIKIGRVFDEKGQIIEDCKYVQQILLIESDYRLDPNDMLRKSKI
ncbi:MAG: U32 family peptidase [Clostridia bacterium]